MAKPTDTSSTGSPRTPSTRKRQTAAASELERWEALVEEERSRLLKAHSILTCVILAMEAEDLPANEGPYWPAVIECACELLDESIRRLEGPPDDHDYAPQVERVASRVEEPPASYALH